jgi:hypothetical protein
VETCSDWLRLRYLRIVILVVSIVALLVAAIGVVFRWDLLFMERDRYYPCDFRLPNRCVGSMDQVDWTDYPQSITLQLVGDCSDCPDCCQLKEIRVFRTATNRATVVLQKDYLRGDSVMASQTRIELEQVEGAWEVKWVGIRLRCRDDPWRPVEICP